MELIAPAGEWVSLRAALQAGADAVYFGAEGCNMRAASRNFTTEEFPEITSICREYGAKAYLALNTILYDTELTAMRRTVDAAKAADIDAVICWDMAVIEACRETGMNIHLSTQASISNYAALKHYAELGVSMVVLARELSLEQVRRISEAIRKDRLEIHIEGFVHGAMCVAVSGRCFMSQDIFGRSANRGECLQPCRRKYLLTDLDDRFELELGEHYVMSPRDLCAITFLDKLIEAGITGLKIEGRNRSPEYVQLTTASYRKAIDTYLKERDNPQETSQFRTIVNELEKELARVYNRGFSSGFYFGKPLNAWIRHHGSLATEKKSYVGTVQKYYPKAGVAEILIHAKGLKAGETISIQGPESGLERIENAAFFLHDAPALRAEKGDTVTIRCGPVRKGDKLYVFEDTGQGSTGERTPEPET